MKYIEIVIGEYRIQIREYGDWWISRDGEGMEISVEEIEKMLESWFSNTF